MIVIIIIINISVTKIVDNAINVCFYIQKEIKFIWNSWIYETNVFRHLLMETNLFSFINNKLFWNWL